MATQPTYRPEHLHYLKMLAKQYPTVQAASTEIINLQAILNLPKATEHFISDVHGEHEAFRHILNSENARKGRSGNNARRRKRRHNYSDIHCVSFLISSKQIGKHPQTNRETQNTPNVRQ